MPSPNSWSAVTSVPLSGTSTTDSLIWGTKWGGSVGSGAMPSFSFPGSSAFWSPDPNTGYGPTINSAREPWNPGYGPLTTTEQAAMRAALQSWGNVANITFVETSDTSTSVGDIRVAYTGSAGGSEVAHSYFPTRAPAAGDIWLDVRHRATIFADLSTGTDGYATLLHEIGHALGLKHPFDAKGISTVTLPAAYDNFSYTVMSYSVKPGLANTGSNASVYPTTPMAIDVQAIQYLYGANTRFHSGNDVYGYTGSGRYLETIWDGGGIDAIRYDAATGGYIDLRPGAWSQLGQPISYGDGTERRETVNIFGTVTIENAIGGSGDDTLIGNAANNVLTGNGGYDSLDGGAGIDIAGFSVARAAAEVVTWRGTTAVLTGPATADGNDRLTNVESLQFADSTVATPAENFRPLDYIASYSDLLAAFGANAQAGFDHFLYAGFHEGRRITFDGLEYIASYGDLIAAFGANADAGATHFITQGGPIEGRTVSFDGLQYIASYGDLIAAFGANADTGATHFITQGGPIEGRTVSFDGLEYIASYGDLIAAFGANADAGATHFITQGGPIEGRTVRFDSAQYLANYADLQVAFGTDLHAATVHYILAGYHEGRTDHPPA